MKRSLIWLLILGKRQLKKISLYVILAVLTVTCISIKYVADNLTVSIKIGILNNDGGNVSTQIEKGLYGNDGIIRFIKYTSYDQLKAHIESGELMGGYVLKENFAERLISGETNQVIEALSTPNSLVSSMTNEIFFSFAMKELSYETLVRDTMDTELFSKLSETEIRDGLREYYDVNLSDGSTFSVDYQNGELEFDGKSFTIDTYDYISPIIIGVIGLMIFIGGLCGNISYYDDRKKGSLTLLKPFHREMVALWQICIPVLVITVVGIIILELTGMGENWIKYVPYGLLVILYSFVLKSIIRKKEIFVSMIHIFILLSIIFCPVFVNIETILPELAVIGKALPLYWLYF